MQEPARLPNQTIIDIAKRHHVVYLGLFGSYARGEAQPGSDVDLYVRYGRPVGLFEVLALKHDIEDAIGLGVDLFAEEAMLLHPSVSASVDRDMIDLYEDGRTPHAVAQ